MIRSAKYFIFIVMVTSCCVAWSLEPQVEMESSPVAVTIQEINDATLQMTLNCPNEPLQYLEKGNDRRVYVEYEYEGQTTEEGKASLPLVTRFIAIPPGAVLQANVIHRQTRTIENVRIVPVVPDGDDPQTRDWVDDEIWLHSDEAYPRESVVVGAGVRCRNLWLVPVTISPTRYYPQDGRLEIDDNLEIQITLQGSSFRDPSIIQGPLVESFHQIYKSVVANYDLLEIDQEPVRGTYLIICPNNQTVIEELHDLVQWKHRKGYPVVLATTAVTGGDMTSIRNYIRNAYETWDRPPEFVCLIGDASGTVSIPTNSSQYDHYYSMMDYDDVPDLCVGRLSVDNTTTLRTVVNKIMHYEKEPYMSSVNWYRKGLVVAGSSSSGISTIHTKRSIRWRMLKHDYAQVDTMWYNMGGSITSAISNGFNGGITILNYRGYLGMSGWSNSNTNNLSNGYMLPIVTTLTCGTGSFNSETSLTEGFLRAGSPTSPKGGIAAIGTATYGTHTKYNNCIDVGIYAGLFDEGMVHLGEALNRGKIELLRNYPGNGTAINHVYWNNLMGDPGLVVWTGIPIPLTVTYEDTIALGSNVFDIHVTSASGAPINEAYACLWQENGTLYEMAYTDVNGDVELNSGDAQLGAFFVTVTKSGYIPHLGGTTVITATQALGLSSAPIDDDNNGQSQGNGNGVWNPDERIEIRPVLWNRGIQSIANIQATLTTDDNLMTIIQGSGNFGTIQAGDSAQTASAFVVDLNPATPADHLCRLSMNITGTSFVQELFIDLNAVSYDVIIRDITVSDGGNGLLEPGETSNILIRLENEGDITANGISAILRGISPHLTVIDSLGTYGNIAPGAAVQNTSNPFAVQASSTVIPGTLVEIMVITTSSEGIVDTAIGSLRIQVASPQGQPLGPDEYGYFCFDNTDSEYPQAPLYAWIEIDPHFSGQGTQINLSDYGNEQDDTELVLLPFIFNYYGQAYDRISVCSNGFLAMGDATYFVNFRNWIIPSPLGAPAMIAPFWDDLTMTSGTGVGKVYYWHDEASHLFIVEWSRVTNRGSGTPQETFEVILYNPQYYTTPSGDGDIVFQYNQVVNVTSAYSDNDYATVGIEDYSQMVGIQYTWMNSYPPQAAALSAGRAIKFTTGPGEAPEPPIISLRPDSFSFTLIQGQESSDTLWVGNHGASTLFFSIQTLNEAGQLFPTFPVPATWPYTDLLQPFVKQNRIDESKGSRGEPGPPAVDNSGGPDAYGYTWIDSDEPGGPVYNWADITDIGTAVQWQGNPDEESFGPVDIGFDFPFYGILYNTIRICSDGYLSFTDTTAQYSNQQLPSSNAPANILAVWWDDLNPAYGGNFYYCSNQIDSFIVTVDSVQGYGPRGGPYYFQAILTRSGKIKYQYQEMGTLRLNEETIGIQDLTRSIGLTVAYNTAYIHDEMAVEFQAPLIWLSINPNQGTTLPGDSISCVVSASTFLLDPGTYNGTLRVISNDILNPSVDIGVSLQVIPNGQVPPTVLDIPNQTINEGETFQTITLDNYVTDPVYTPEQITWTTFGAQQLEVTIVNRIATVTIPNEDWFGDETISFRATNPLNLWDSDPATFTVLSVNDPPMIDPGLPDITFRNDSLATLELDEYGRDIEDPDSLLSWTFIGNTSVQIVIDNDHVATFTAEPGFVGTEQVIFTLRDSGDSTDVDTILVTVESASGVPGGGETAIPDDYFLAQNYPNPFNPTTTIKFGLPEPSQVRLVIYNILGQQVAILVDGALHAGYHQITFESAGLSSGLYFFSIEAPKFHAVRKMALMR